MYPTVTYVYADPAALNRAVSTIDPEAVTDPSPFRTVRDMVLKDYWGPVYVEHVLAEEEPASYREVSELQEA